MSLQEDARRYLSAAEAAEYLELLADGFTGALQEFTDRNKISDPRLSRARMLRVKIEAARDPVAHERKRKIVASLIAVSRAAPLQPIVRTERAPEPTPIVAQLADWIFARRGQDSSYDDLLKQAGKHERFRNEDFLAAFHCVYKTKRGNRPATGWPLQPDFQRRAAK